MTRVVGIHFFYIRKIDDRIRTEFFGKENRVVVRRKSGLPSRSDEDFSAERNSRRRIADDFIPAQIGAAGF